jgi:hypothetical protein
MGRVLRSGLRGRLLAVTAALLVGTVGAVVVPKIAGATPADSQCTGMWHNSAVDVQYRTDFSGRVYWDTWLSAEAYAAHTSPVTVTMPYAYVNGQPINPPYGPHVMSKDYDYHGSALRVTFLGGGSRDLLTGDELTLSWFLDSAGASSFGQIRCTVPSPGSG